MGRLGKRSSRANAWFRQLDSEAHQLCDSYGGFNRLLFKEVPYDANIGYSRPSPYRNYYRLGQTQGASRDGGSSVEQAIRQLDHERIQAQISADAVALDRIYAEDFVGVGPSGTVRTKPQVISDFTSGDLKFQSITTDEVQVRVYENTAVETGLSTMVGQDKGKAVPRDTRFTRVWVKQEGRWRLVANHYSLRVSK